MIKKQIQHQHKNSNNSSTELTSEIRGLLQKLASYQDSRSGDFSHAHTSRQMSNAPMSMESMVELKSNVSSS